MINDLMTKEINDIVSLATGYRVSVSIADYTVQEWQFCFSVVIHGETTKQGYITALFNPTVADAISVATRLVVIVQASKETQLDCKPIHNKKEGLVKA